MQRLTAHQAAVNHEQRHHRMHLERRAREPYAAGDLVEDPALGDPVGHHGVEAEGGGDGGALEVAGLAAGVLGDVSAVGGDVEAREAREPAEHEDGEEDVVEGCAHADAEGYAGGGEAEGDL